MSISQGKAGWVGPKLGGVESQMWSQPSSSVRRGFRKGTMASARLDVKHLSFSLCATGDFQAATQVLELRGNESE